MPVGSSGRIVIEINPELKKELYEQLGKENLNLKQCFLCHVDDFLSDKNQLNLHFDQVFKDSHKTIVIEAK